MSIENNGVTVSATPEQVIIFEKFMAHRARVRINTRKYRQAHPEKIKAYREEHKDEIRTWRKGYNQSHLEERRAYWATQKDNYRKYYLDHRDEILTRIRQTELGGGKDKLRGLNKRIYPNPPTCELCGRTFDRMKMLSYHHWQDPDVGIWVCHKCHRMCERVDDLATLDGQALAAKYIDTKIALAIECNQKCDFETHFALQELLSTLPETSKEETWE